MSERTHALLVALYGAKTGAEVDERLQRMLERYGALIPQRNTKRVDQHSSVLITYGDMVRQRGQSPLRTLGDFLSAYLHGVVDSVHLLPFFPYSSDDGFSVIDYRQVDPALGTWAEISRIGESFELMFDLVINHVSAESEWFQAYLQREQPYRDYFIEVGEDVDVSQVFRPRTLPLFTEVHTAAGLRLVWTTFSADQIDLNFANPSVLLTMMDVLLDYVSRGASLIRLDAIAFIWKEPGTLCIHLPEAHWIVQLFRAVLDEVAPHVSLITETNVPHRDNVSYFGDGTNEAQMVYNFTLPPLTLHTFHSGDATALTDWAAGLEWPSNEVAFFNFLASHDGIGVTPVRGILSDKEIDALAQRVLDLGGHVSFRRQSDGSDAAYELNINYLDALADPAMPDEPIERVAQRFLATQAIMLALRGVPGIYFHSLFGSRGWPEGVSQTGRPRTINRQKLNVVALERELADPVDLRHLVFSGYRRMLLARKELPAFDPAAEQQILSLDPALFALIREAPGKGSRVLCLHNVSGEELAVTVSREYLPGQHLLDVIGQLQYVAEGNLSLTLSPYAAVWLAAVAPAS